MSNSEDLKNIEDILTSINNIKNNLAVLDLDPRLKAYFDYNINPLLSTLTLLSTASYNIASSTNTLALLSKSSRTKDFAHLVFHMNKECEHIFHVLDDKIDELLCIAKNE